MAYAVYDRPVDPTGGDPFNTKFGYAGLRWAETQTHLTVENTFMAVILDTPDRPTPTPINGVPGADEGFNVRGLCASPRGRLFCRRPSSALLRVALMHAPDCCDNPSGALAVQAARRRSVGACSAAGDLWGRRGHGGPGRWRDQHDIGRVCREHRAVWIGARS